METIAEIARAVKASSSPKPQGPPQQGERAAWHKGTERHASAVRLGGQGHSLVLGQAHQFFFAARASGLAPGHLGRLFQGHLAFGQRLGRGRQVF